MTATYGALARVDYGARTNVTQPLPAGVANGDMLIWCVVTGNSTQVTPSFPAGWTAMGSPQTGADAGSFDWCAVMGYRVASSEPASYTATHAACSSESLMLRIDGTGTLSVDAFSQGTHTADGSATTTAPAVTTTVADDLLIFLSLNWDEAALAPPTGMTERQDSEFVYLATQALSATGSTGDRTQTHSFSPWFGNLVAIKDVGGGGAAQDITGALYANTNTIYGATLSASNTITGARLDNSATFYGATVSPGPVNITGSLFTNSNAFHGATIAQDGAPQSITGARIENAQTFYGATVEPGAVTVSGALVTNASSFFGANVAVASDQTVTASRVANESVFFAATVAHASHQPGGGYSRPVILVDREGRPVDLKKKANQAVQVAKKVVKALPAEKKQEAKADIRALEAAVRAQVAQAVADRAQELRAQFAGVSETVEAVLLELERLAAEEAEDDEEAAMLLLVA